MTGQGQTDAAERLILALDVDSFDAAAELLDLFDEHVGTFKVGLELYSAVGPNIVSEIHRRGKRVFLDLKFHDIPTTVAKAGIVAAREGVFMFNMHASGGSDMMLRCREEVVNVCLRENLVRPKMIAVTVLTSMGQDVLKGEIGIQHGLRTHVRHLAALALKAGLDGVVASAEEAATIRSHCGRGFLIVTPGIRPAWASADDQKRVMTPRGAIREGADYLVMGRAILRHADPVKAVQLTVREMAGREHA